MSTCLTFDAVGEPATLAQRWTTWKEEFELFVTASGISDSTQKRALLLHLAGPKVRDIFNNSIPEGARGEAKDYNKAMDCLSDHFKMRKNVPMARQAFIAVKPNVGETINNFITRLQKLAEHCDYGEERDNQVRDHAISYIKDKNLKSKLYREETLTLNKLMEIVGEYHDQEALILLSDRVNNIQISSKNKGRCWRCDKAGHYARECRSSRDHKCGKCGKVGHFEVCCHSRSKQPETRQGTNNQSTHVGGNRGRNKKRSDVRQVTDGELPAAVPEKQAYDGDYYHVFSVEDIDEENFLELKIEDKFVKIVIDSGASCNLISHEMLDFITGGKVNLSPCDKKIYAYAAVNPLELDGKCKLNVYVPQTNQQILTEFYVTSGRAVTLLGRKASQTLGLLKIGVSLHISTERKAVFKTKVPQSFSRTRCRPKVVQKIEELVELDVIEKVEGPTSWVNPLVVVEKPNGDVRICLDMRHANKAIKREKHPVPTAEEILQEISEAKVFTKLDLNMVFHQIELHPDLRDITTFAAPNGLYRYKRLIFGVNMATEKFQNIIWQVIKDCPDAYNIHDDLRVVGATDKEHDENLERVMRKLEENGLMLNYEKCEVGINEMVYMGDVLSGDGLQLSEKRVKAIVDAPEPKNQSEPWLIAVLCKVYPEFCNRVESFMGSHEERCQVEVGRERKSSCSRN
ncbi:Transposon Tf2-9 poly [Paramuricea clavata]|uniref:Transposon Tf2-9 poly n=1 Tax=Paramuricea clavata TaxID=317549 RepID=A0A6S7HNW3_PARCT|nr:Transposon Tf2-9 poly [Paramuricea clavata]